MFKEESTNKSNPDIIEIVETYFDKVDAFLELRDYASAQTMLARISPYLPLFDNVYAEYYNNIQDLLDSVECSSDVE